MSRKWISIIHFVFFPAFLLTACTGGGETGRLQTGTPPGTAEVTAMFTEAPGITTESAADAVTESPAATVVVPTSTQASWEASTVESIRVNVDPILDGVASEAAWANARPASIPVAGGANHGAALVSVRSVYTANTVYFLVAWADPSESWLLVPWEKQADGSWKRLTDPNDRGGDNNQFYEDGIAFTWPIQNSVPGFESTGCFVACHAGEITEQNPYGTKYLSEDSQLADVWHWRSVRSLNQVDDGYLDSSTYSGENPGAGLHPDPNSEGGYVVNETEDQTIPAYMPPTGGNKDGSPGYILDDEKAPLDDSQFEEGDRLPGIIKAEFQGDRGQISGGWTYAGGMWTLELGRDLVTGSEFDVQFDDIGGSYFFGLATFDNAQVRHGFQTGSTVFIFQQ
jgi:hypothetical protein